MTAPKCKHHERDGTMVGPMRTEALAAEVAAERLLRRRPGCYGFAFDGWSGAGDGWYVGTCAQLSRLCASSVKCTGAQQEDGAP